MSSFNALAKERYSVRKFADKPVEDEKIQAILEAGMLAPTAVNNQPVKCWVFKSKEALEKLAETNPFEWADKAPVAIVVGANAEQAWLRKLDNYNFADVDASIVATHIMMAITDQGLGSTWCGHFDQDKLKESFPQMKGYNLIAMFPIGYIADDCEPNPRHFESKSKEDMVEEV